MSRQSASFLRIGRIEWPTVLLILFCYAVWFALAMAGRPLGPWIWIPVTGIVTTLYWSIVHEVVHGHPTSNVLVNRMLVGLPIGWVYAFGRFADGHLQHHATGELTDPFDDPESWYLQSRDWGRLSPLMRGLLRFNNTLFGRMLIGPVIVFWRMIVEDIRSIAADRARGRLIARDWLIHIPAVALLVTILIYFANVPAWWFAAAAYLGVSVLLIRTYLEHQAAEDVGERTVIIEDRGPLAFLFLFNNLHVVHHTRPGLAWYYLPGFYRRHRAQFVRRNNCYVYKSYWQIFRLYFFRAKEPVVHPIAG